MFSNGFAPLINKPTRISQNNATLLDHIWSNSLVSMKINCGIVTHCISNHLPVIMCTSISKIFHQNVQQCRHFSDQNVSLFSKAFSESGITPILCDSNPNSSYPKITNAIPTLSLHLSHQSRLFWYKLIQPYPTSSLNSKNDFSFFFSHWNTNQS